MRNFDLKNSNAEDLSLSYDDDDDDNDRSSDKGIDEDDDEDEEFPDKMKRYYNSFLKKVPYIFQSIIFSIAYFELSAILLRFLNKKIFKLPIQFKWNIYDIATKS